MKKYPTLICVGLLIIILFMASTALCKNYEFTVRNIDGYNMPSCGGTIKIALYDTGYYPYKWDGKCSFRGGEQSVNVKVKVPDGALPTTYKVYQTPKCSLKKLEYWGAGDARYRGTDFTRLMPYIRDFTANGMDASRGISGTVYSPISFRIKIKSNINIKLKTQPCIYIKKGRWGSIQYVQGEARQLYGSDTWFLTYTPKERGTYYFNAIVTCDPRTASDTRVTDQRDWVKMVIK